MGSELRRLYRHRCVENPVCRERACADGRQPSGHVFVHADAATRDDVLLAGRLEDKRDAEEFEHGCPVVRAVVHDERWWRWRRRWWHAVAVLGNSSRDPGYGESGEIRQR